ncbi:MAG TPA: class I SAM-dependent methyltransferase [Kiritimatiellae bacterium]|nr:class I SAM-dependent methyltransferase [Kiritimatiellia bacterium]
MRRQDNAFDPTAIDWWAYYQHEHEVSEFAPDADEIEPHRCYAAWSVFPRERLHSLLDVGCGDGYFCHWIKGRTRMNEVTGVDISRARVEKARRRYRGLTFLEAGLPRLPFEDRQFDVVTCIEVLEHLADPISSLAELSRVARRFVVITVPDRQPIRWLLCPHCLKPFPACGHVNSFDADSLTRMCTRAGLQVQAIRVYHVPAGFDAGIPMWLGGLVRRLLLVAKPRRGLFLAARCRPADT